jgi:glutamine synthetase
MAGLDGVNKKIDPIKAGYGPLEVSGYELKDASSSRFTPGSLEESLNALEKDHQFLTEGNVFGKNFVELWMDYKRDEICRVAEHPTAPEFDRYFDC